jgi:hypothetical protein
MLAYVATGMGSCLSCVISEANACGTFVALIISADTAVSCVGSMGSWIISGMDKEVIGIIISTCKMIKKKLGKHQQKRACNTFFLYSYILIGTPKIVPLFQFTP